MIQWYKDIEPKSFFIGVAFAISVVLLSANFWPTQKAPKYHPQLAATVMTPSTWRASKKFLGLADCNAKGTPHDTSINWEKLTNYGVANVCLFYLFEELGSPKAVVAWLVLEGFQTSTSPNGVSSATTLSHFGYSPQSDVFRVSAKWGLSSQAKKFAKQSVALGEYSQHIGVKWFPDGKLLSVNANVSSI